MEQVIELKHPLIQHKISRLRDKNTGTSEFRALVEEIAMLMGYEALSDLPLHDIEVATAQQKVRLAARKVNILIDRVTHPAPCIITIFGKQLTGIISNMRNVAKIVATDIIQPPNPVLLHIYRRRMVITTAKIKLFF